MKKWVGVVVVIGVMVIAIIGVTVWRSGVVGKGYAIGGVGQDESVIVEDPALLEEIAEGIQQAGGVMGTVLMVSQGGVDTQTEYAVSIPSMTKPIGAISGCRKPVTLLGLISFMRVEVDTEWVTKVWGEEADKRVNGLMVACLIHGMSRGEPNVFNQAVAKVVKTMAGERVFGIVSGGTKE